MLIICELIWQNLELIEDWTDFSYTIIHSMTLYMCTLYTVLCSFISSLGEHSEVSSHGQERCVLHLQQPGAHYQHGREQGRPWLAPVHCLHHPLPLEEQRVKTEPRGGSSAASWLSHAKFWGGVCQLLHLQRVAGICWWQGKYWVISIKEFDKKKRRKNTLKYNFAVKIMKWKFLCKHLMKLGFLLCWTLKYFTCRIDPHTYICMCFFC